MTYKELAILLPGVGVELLEALGVIGKRGGDGVGVDGQTLTRIDDTVCVHGESQG